MISNFTEEEKTALILNRVNDIESNLYAMVKLLYAHQMDILRVEGLVKCQKFMTMPELNDLQEKYNQLKELSLLEFQDAFNKDVSDTKEQIEFTLENELRGIFENIKK